MASICIDRVMEVLNQWESQGMISEWDASHTAIQFKDVLYGTGRFTNTLQVTGPNVKITVRLFAGIEGDDRSVRAAFAYLLNLPFLDATVTIQRDTASGNVGASVTFPCVSNRHQLEVHLGNAMNTLTTYLEARYDRMVADLLELGVTFK
ncbi:MAG: hypothetical protein ABI970_15235 [Chloroflexota bacterium]